MFLNCILLSLCVTIDSLGIGITYGLKNTNILFGAKIVLFICSFIVSLLSILLGDLLLCIFPGNITELIGCLVLVVIGRIYDFFLF